MRRKQAHLTGPKARIGQLANPQRGGVNGGDSIEQHGLHRQAPTSVRRINPVKPFPCPTESLSSKRYFILIGAYVMNAHEIARRIRTEHIRVQDLADSIRETTAVLPRTDHAAWIAEVRDRFDHFTRSPLERMGVVQSRI